MYILHCLAGAACSAAREAMYIKPIIEFKIRRANIPSRRCKYRYNRYTIPCGDSGNLEVHLLKIIFT